MSFSVECFFELVREAEVNDVLSGGEGKQGQYQRKEVHRH